MNNHDKCPRCGRTLDWFPSSRPDATPGDGFGELLYTDADGSQACANCLDLPATIAERLAQLDIARLNPGRTERT